MSRRRTDKPLRFKESQIIKKRYYSALDSVAVLSENDYVYHEVRPRIEQLPTFFFITNKTGYDLPKGYYLYVINDISGIEPIIHETEMMSTLDNLLINHLLYKKDPERIVDMIQKRVLASLAYLGNDEKFIL